MEKSNGTKLNWAIPFLTGVVITMAGSGVMSYAAFWRDTATSSELKRVEEKVAANTVSLTALTTRVDERLRAIDENQKDIKGLLNRIASTHER